MTEKNTNGKLQSGDNNNPEKIKKMNDREIAEAYIRTQIHRTGTPGYASLIIAEMKARNITATEVAEYLK